MEVHRRASKGRLNLPYGANSYAKSATNYNFEALPKSNGGFFWSAQASSTLDLSQLEFEHDSNRDLWAVLVGVEEMSPEQLGFRALRYSPVMGLDVDSASRHIAKSALSSERSPRSQMRSAYQAVSPQFH